MAFFEWNGNVSAQDSIALGCHELDLCTGFLAQVTHCSPSELLEETIEPFFAQEGSMHV